MPKTKHSYTLHLNSIARDFKFEPVADGRPRDATLDCPEMLKQFEEDVLELFSPSHQMKSKPH